MNRPLILKRSEPRPPVCVDAPNRAATARFFGRIVSVIRAGFRGAGGKSRPGCATTSVGAQTS
jgi:hypothetical protein